MAKKNFKAAGVSAFLSDTPLSDATDVASFENGIHINPLFQSLIPRLSEEEKNQLEINLVQHGIREPICLWGNTIIDGHNRYELAQKHGLLLKTISYEFESENDVLLWIINNQFGRRNLSLWTRSLLALKLKPVIAEKAKENQATNKIQLYQNSDKAGKFDTDVDEKIQLYQNSDKAGMFDTSVDEKIQPYRNSDKTFHTYKELASIAGVSHDTINKVENIIKIGTPGIIEALERGEISINRAHQELLLKNKKKDVSANVQNILDISGKYSVIYVNYPWDAETSVFRNNLSACYPFLKNIANLKKLDIPTEEDAILFMWSTDTHLETALQVMNAWKFKYKTHMVWDGGFSLLNLWTHSRHELLLIGVKGNFLPPPENFLVASVYCEQRYTFGEKPSYFCEQIEKMFPNEKYLALFSNADHNKNWKIWGTLEHGYLQGDA